ncbi:methyl-accepting chemotaxis protein [Echinimonas agarilytica]|uniref:Methyl-accepting chemotaxis protein n=1 Tax=Echinimonas agarilytica TaxID=1215918 RepID=A0AA41W6U9_9GAMM|nr:nitrate- and nitrite sensing domain-containing protein [Echinimonas agarilytica]MCM2679746.1 methyl-accepting chemotaxis protein [Echinimonas agarilytica]
MKLLRNLSFRLKLTLLVAPALLGAIVLSVLQLDSKLDEQAEITEITPIVDLSIVGTRIVHELQKERGASAAFLGSKGKSFGNTLAGQRRETDQVLSGSLPFLKALNENIRESHDEVHRDLTSIISALSQLTRRRAEVDAQSISIGDVVGFYSSLNTLFFKLSAAISNSSNDGRMTTLLGNVYILSQIKELSGLERAVLSTILSSPQPTQDMYDLFIGWESTQLAMLNIFKQFVTADITQQVGALESSSAAVNVKRIRSIVRAKFNDGDFGVDGEEWFQSSTSRINGLKDLEDQLADNLVKMVEGKKSTANRHILYYSVFIALLMLLSFGLAYSVSKLLISQAQELANTINRVAQHKDLSLRAPEMSSDELGQSAQSLNVMMDVMSDMLSKIENNSVRLSAAADLTNSSVAENAGNLDRQSMETSQAATATEEMTATVNEIASSTTMTADSAKHAAEMSASGLSEVQSNAEKMNMLNMQMSEANTQVLQLKDSSKEINEIVDVIKSIAEQTNLLALNAAIEAARAGDQGRGFAVVADEVRTLAQRTQESTEKIESMVLRFQNEADGVSKSIEASFSDVRTSLENTVSVKTKLDEINSAISSITGMCNQVATAAEEQVAATNEIAMNIRAINDLANISAEVGKTISEAAKEQKDLAESQQALVKQFKLSA